MMIRRIKKRRKISRLSIIDKNGEVENPDIGKNISNTHERVDNLEIDIDSRYKQKSG